jgi:tRNA (cmo5U34)-methyltransferase
VFNGLIYGGAFVFAEKVYSDNSQIQDAMTFMFYDYKRQHFSDKDILDKEKQLRHMLKPDTYNDLINMCKTAGFKTVESFWRNHNFVGFIAIKG